MDVNVHADWDSDGKMDISGPIRNMPGSIVLGMQRGDGEGNFSELTRLPSPSQGGTTAFNGAIDANCDGAPDLFLGQYFGCPLLLNNGFGQ